MKKLFLCAALLTANWCTYGADSSRSVAKFTDDTICRFSNHTCYVEAMLQLIEERTKAGKPFPSQIRIEYDQYVEKKIIEAEPCAKERVQICKDINDIYGKLKCGQASNRALWIEFINLWSKIFCTKNHIELLKISGAFPMVADGILGSPKCEGVTLWRGVNIYTFLAGKLIAEVENALTESSYSYLPIFSSCLQPILEVGEFEKISDLIENNRYWNHIALDFANINLLVNNRNSFSSMDSVSCALLGAGGSVGFPSQNFINGLVLHGVKYDIALALEEEYRHLILKYYENKNNGALICITIPKNKVNTYAMMCEEDGKENWQIIPSDGSVSYDPLAIGEVKFYKNCYFDPDVKVRANSYDPLAIGEVKFYKKGYFDPDVKVRAILREKLMSEFLPEYETIKQKIISAIKASEVNMSDPNYVRTSMAMGVSAQALLQSLKGKDLTNEGIKDAFIKGIASLVSNDSISQKRKEQILGVINDKIGISRIITTDIAVKIRYYNARKYMLECLPADDPSGIPGIFEKCTNVYFKFRPLSMKEIQMFVLWKEVRMLTTIIKPLVISDVAISIFSELLPLKPTDKLTGLRAIKEAVQKRLSDDLFETWYMTESPTEECLIQYSLRISDILKFAYEYGMTSINFGQVYRIFNKIMNELIEKEIQKASSAPVTLLPLSELSLPELALSESDAQQDDSVAQTSSNASSSSSM